MPNTPEEIAVLVSMGLPPFKYKVGDVVYVVTSQSERRTHPCPDCLGTKKWHVTTPAGTKMTTPCQRCCVGHSSSRERHLNLEYTIKKFTTRMLTIGQLRPESWSGDTHSYMCRETGIGSGNVYRESDLFADLEVAERAAAFKASEAEAVRITTPQAIEQKHYSELPTCQAQHSWDFSSMYNAWTRAREYREQLEEIAKGEVAPWNRAPQEDRDSIQELIEDEYRFTNVVKYHVGKNAVEVLIKASQAFVDGVAGPQAIIDALDMFPKAPEPIEPLKLDDPAS